MTDAANIHRGHPTPSWLVVRSLWLVPILFGFGVTTGLGFIVLAVMTRRMRWALLGIVLSIAAVMGFPVWALDWLAVQWVFAGYADWTLLPLFVVYVVGVVVALWRLRAVLELLWERRVARGGVPAAHEPVLASAAPVAPEAANDAAERSAVLARASDGFQKLLARQEEAALQPAEAAGAAVGVAAVTAVEPLSLADLLAEPLDLRTASAAELALVPGLGAEGAARLVAMREAGEFVSLDQALTSAGLSAYDAIRARAYVRLG